VTINNTSNSQTTTKQPIKKNVKKEITAGERFFLYLGDFWIQGRNNQETV